VTRITATDTKKTPSKEPKTATRATAQPLKKAATPLIGLSRYFAGAWVELKQVRWPTRQATWSMTGAMLGFTAFFVVLILLLDALFKYVFELMLG
jgi:preprotein translocase SecE subunit